MLTKKRVREIIKEEVNRLLEQVDPTTLKAELKSLLEIVSSQDDLFKNILYDLFADNPNAAKEVIEAHENYKKVLKKLIDNV